ncbi:dTDP-glucose 4,6-dehydratase [Candidatus Paraburkholderia calva]|nr:dTDP-glucose 4,6-dehydratase [Candidatus Paraburkholderia calva]
MKVFITGGVGFVGGHLTKSLGQDGHTVHLLDNFKRGVQDPFVEDLVGKHQVKVINADLLDEASLGALDDDYTHIYHLAAIIGVVHVLQRPYEVLTANVRMTENVIALARRQKALQRLLFSSTSEVYAGTLVHMDIPIPTPETTPIALTALEQPRTSYMLSKLYGEAMCNMSGVPVTNVRLHNVYGPRMGMSHVIPELLFKAWKAKDGDSLDVFSAGHKRTFCYVSDAVRMIRALAEADSAVGQTVNIGNESPEVTIGELAKVVVSTVGRELKLVPQPATAGSPARRCPSMRLLDKLTGVQGQVGLEEGVGQTYRWYHETVFEGQGKTAQ